MLGGADIEKRIDVGIKVFRKWTKGFSPDVVRDRTNDLAGVFYMARSSRAVRDIFRDQGFEVDVVPSESFVEYYDSIAEKLTRRLDAGRPPKAIIRTMVWFFDVCRFFSLRSSVIDRSLGLLFTLAFTMVPHRFRAVKTD
jgi:hypothetical protein